MIRRHVLAALTAGIEAGDEDVARASLEQIDLVLRRPARRRLENVLLDAALAIGAVTEDLHAVRHRLRAAVLIASNRRVCDLAVRDAVTAAYADIAVPPPARLPIATGVAAVAAMACAMMVVFALVRVVAVGATNAEYRRPPPPPVAGAFRHGGVPIHNTAIERALTVELPALDAHRVTDEAGRASRVASLRDHRAFANHGAELAAAWRGLIDTFAHWQELGSSARSSHRLAAVASRELRARVDAVSDRLAAIGLGYVLDVELGDTAHRRTGIYAFRVDEIRFVRARPGDARQRVLGVRRLDHLTEEVARLGHTAGELRDPVVLLDEVDQKVRTQILPILGGQSYVVGDASWARTARGRQVALAATGAIRRELHTALGFDVDAPERATTRCRMLVAASVRHHEAQHGFDRDRALPHPAALALYTGPASSDLALRTRYELSGYLSQIASDTWLPQLTLWNLSRHAFRRTPAHLEEAYVAVYVIEGLAKQLGIASPGPVLHDGAIDRDRLATLVLPLAARSTTELRSAAAALWGTTFGDRLPRIVDDE